MFLVSCPFLSPPWWASISARNASFSLLISTEVKLAFVRRGQKNPILKFHRYHFQDQGDTHVLYWLTSLVESCWFDTHLYFHVLHFSRLCRQWAKINNGAKNTVIYCYQCFWRGRPGKAINNIFSWEKELFVNNQLSRKGVPKPVDRLCSYLP